MWYILSVFSSSKCSLFHNSNICGSCIIHILYTGCAKIKKNPGAKRLSFIRYDYTQYQLKETSYVTSSDFITLIVIKDLNIAGYR